MFFSGSQPFSMHPPYNHFETFTSYPVRVRRLVLITIGTIFFTDDNNLINKSGTKTNCEIMALGFVDKICDSLLNNLQI